MTILQAKLANGIEIVVDPMPGLETVAIEAAIRTGSAHETEAQHGMAHFVEHMIFHGSQSASSIEVQNQLQQLGSDMNATTDLDATSFNLIGLRENVDATIGIFSKLLANPSFDQNDLDLEKKIVLDELRGRKGSGEVMNEGFWACAYDEHAITRPTIGTEESIGAFTLDAVREFSSKNYVSGNLTISVAGAVDPQEVKASIERHFAAMPAGERAEAVPLKFFGGEAHFPCPCENGRIMLGFPMRCTTLHQQQVTEVLQHIIGGGPTSRLFQEVREKRGLAYDVCAWTSNHLGQAMMVLDLNGHSKSNREMFAVMVDVLSELQNSISSDELQQAKGMIAAYLRMNHDMNFRRADRASHYMAEGLVVPDLQQELLAISTVNADDLRAELARMLSVTPALAVHGLVRKMPTLADYQAQVGVAKAA